MLGYLLRTAPVFVRALGRRDGSTVSRLHDRVRLSEVDPNLHMNQACYLQAIERGRGDLLIRSGAFGRWRDQGIKPVVADQSIVYRRELKPLQRYVVDSRATAVEGRLLRFEHAVLVGDRVHATSICHAIFIGPDGVLAPDAVPPICEDLLSEPLRIEDWRVV